MIVSETCYEGLRDVLRRSQRRTTKVSEMCYEGLRGVTTKVSETCYEGLRDVFSWYFLYVLETSPEDVFPYFLQDQLRTNQQQIDCLIITHNKVYIANECMAP